VNFDEERFRDLCEKAAWERAFEVLVAGHAPSLLRMVRRWVPDLDEAEDVVQNALIKTWKGLPGFRFESKPSSWLYRIAYNEAMDFLRKEQRKRKRISGHTASELQIAGDSHFDGDRAQKALAEALSKLPQRQKQVFELRYFDEMPYAQIAEALGLSEGALKASYFHAVRKIEESLKSSLLS